jgi:hypothetical protein
VTRGHVANVAGCNGGKPADLGSQQSETQKKKKRKIKDMAEREQNIYDANILDEGFLALGSKT